MNDNSNDNNNPELQQLRDFVISAADKEAAAVAKGRARAEKRRKRLELSTTSAGHKAKEKNVLSIAEALNGFKIHVDNSGGGPKPKWYPLVEQMPSEQVAEIALTACLDAIGKDWSLNTLFHQCGRMFNTHLFHVFLSSQGNSDERRANKRLLKNLDERARRSVIQENRSEWALKKASDKGFAWSDLDDHSTRSVGAIMVSAVFAGCDLFEKQELPREDQLTDKDGNLITVEERFIGFTAEAEQKLSEDNEFLDGQYPMFAPMLHEPRPWSEDSIGPYADPALAKLVPLVKHMGADQQAAVREGYRDGSISQCVEALNYLQRVPYTVNTYIYEAILWVLEQKKTDEVSGFPIVTKTKVPRKIKKEEFALLATDDKVDTVKERNTAIKGNREAVANKFNIQRHLAEALELSVQNCFYLPHQFDTRSRIYHTSDFGPHNTDYLRALLLFKNKTRVGDGLEWLALQLANTWGDGDGQKVDKSSYDDRIAWVNANLEQIYEAGRDFEDAFDFWRKADDPFQFLAACHEFYNYQHEGPDYLSGLPIGLDATQSGIQHYAAASLDENDGELVNLVPGEVPNDLYEVCLAESYRLIDDDIVRLEAMDLGEPANDNEPPDEEVVKLRKRLHNAKQLKNYPMKRKQIKRNCMTWAYSSKKFGFAKQLQKDWMDELSRDVRRGKLAKHPFDRRGFSVSHYAAEMNERAISNVVKSAAGGMNFFQMLAEIMSAEGLHIKFVTPLGFPMFQYYRTETGTQRQKIWLFDRETKLLDKKATASFRGYTEVVKKTKSSNAISPNIIHAMDATHLMLTVLSCQDNGINDLMVIHDSFSTTIGNASMMRDILRLAFVELYTDYCLYTDLLNQCKARHPNPDSVEWPEVPAKGHLDLKLVLESDYFFT